MLKSVRRILSITLAAALLLTVTACGIKKEDVSLDGYSFDFDFGTVSAYAERSGAKQYDVDEFIDTFYSEDESNEFLKENSYTVCGKGVSLDTLTLDLSASYLLLPLYDNDSMERVEYYTTSLRDRWKMNVLNIEFSDAESAERFYSKLQKSIPEILNYFRSEIRKEIKRGKTEDLSCIMGTLLDTEDGKTLYESAYYSGDKSVLVVLETALEPGVTEGLNKLNAVCEYCGVPNPAV